jgi:beta-lactamase regulating signal transducer with metallopeptidase domain
MNAELLLTALLRLTLLASFALLLLAAGRPLLRRALGARATYAAWLLVPLLLASPWLPRTSLPASAALALPAALPLAPAHAKPVNAAVAARPASHGPMALLLTWMLGAATLAAAQWRAQRRYEAGLWRDAHGQWLAPAGQSPAVVGLWPARLVLPADFERRFDAPTRQLMLAHEAVHLRRHDTAWNLLALLLLCLQWFNPLAWWGRRALRDDQELACDEAVLDAAIDPAARARYASALLAAHQGPGHPALASGWTSSHPLVQRVQWLSRWRRTSRVRRLAAAALVAGLGAAAGLVARAAQEPTVPAPVPAPTSAGAQGLVFEVASQVGRRDWHHADMTLPLNRPLLGGPAGVMLQSMLPGWCLYVSLYTFADGSVRPTAQPMDETCQRPLADWQELPTNGRVAQFVAQTAQGPLQAQVSARWTLPQHPAVPSLTRAETAALPQLSAAQQAEITRQREHIAQIRRDMDAQDRAWRAAREAQPGTR